MTASWVDGNQLAGPLDEIFAVDVTAARGRCRHCGQTGEIARARVFDEQGPGLVARCPGCAAVLLRVVRGPGRAFLDLSGLSCVELALPG